MKKLISVFLLIAASLLLCAGCGENEKISEIDSITDIKVSTGYYSESDESVKSLDEKDRAELLSAFESVVGGTVGKSADEVTDELVDGGFMLIFTDGENRFDNMGINGRYFIYNGKYYRIPESTYSGVYNILSSAY